MSGTLTIVRLRAFLSWLPRAYGRGRPPIHGPALRRRIMELHDQGVPAAAIGAAVGCSVDYPRRAIARAGKKPIGKRKSAVRA